MNESPAILRFKSDNCATQYKSKHIFHFWSNIAAQYRTKAIVYYGVSGHGKGLVDAMSSFGAKAPLRKAVITEDFNFNSAYHIYEYLDGIFAHDKLKHHFFLEKGTIQNKQNDSVLKISGCQSMHMICFNPDGTVVGKVNICSCEKCLIGDFERCFNEKGIAFRAKNDNTSESESSSDEDEQDDLELAEQYEMRAESVIDIVEKNTVVALYSPPRALELFYLCHVVGRNTVD